MLKIRLMRIGTKKRPFYRVVVVDEREKRTGKYIELLGTYNPLTEPKDIKLAQDRVDYWVKKGAQPSDGYLRMIGKAPQRPPRKPKKQGNTETQNKEETQKAEANTSEVKHEPKTSENTSEVSDEQKPEEEKSNEGSA